MKALITLVAATMLVTGCQKLAYQPPMGDDTATVVFTSDNLAVQPMICVPGKGFKPTEFAVAQAPFKSEFFDQLNESIKKKETVESRIATGGAVRLGFSYSAKDPNSKGPSVGDRCKVAILFTPEPGARYDAHFSLPGGECAMSLTAGGTPVADAVIAPWECR